MCLIPVTTLEEDYLLFSGVQDDRSYLCHCRFTLPANAIILATPQWTWTRTQLFRFQLVSFPFTLKVLQFSPASLVERLCRDVQPPVPVTPVPWALELVNWCESYEGGALLPKRWLLGPCTTSLSSAANPSLFPFSFIIYLSSWALP